jgi:hypothetical protein
MRKTIRGPIMDDANKNAEDLIARIKDSTDTFRKHQCRHTMPEGERCGSPAMNGEKFCYHHHQTRRPIADARLRRTRRNAFGMPTPNSRAEIQDSLARIISRVAGNDIDLRRAGLLLYALQLASTNLTEHQRHHQSPKQTLSTEPEPAAQPEHPHYGTGPRPQFAPNGEPISTIQTTPQPSQDSAPDFTPPPAKWHRLQPGTGRLLLEQLGRHHSKDNPLPGKPEDRRSEPMEDSSEPTQTIPTIQAVATTHKLSFRPKRSRVEKSASLPTPPTEPQTSVANAATISNPHSEILSSGYHRTTAIPDRSRIMDAEETWTRARTLKQRSTPGSYGESLSASSSLASTLAGATAGRVLAPWDFS